MDQPSPETFGAYIANAIEWATARLGSTEYAGKCLSFVEDAFEQSNHIEMFGGASAHESAEEYQAASQRGTPPRGAFVFYDWIGTLNGARKNWGHVGLMLDDDKIIHAWDVVRVDDYHAIENLIASDNTHPTYLGWTQPQRFLQGMKQRNSQK